MGGQYARMEEDVLTAIIQEAHNFGLIVAVRTASLEEARQATEAGADALVGGVTLTGEQVDGSLLNLMQERETYYVPTLSAVEASSGDLLSVESLNTALTNTRLVHQAGVTIVAGTGTVGPGMEYGASMLRELELLVEAGLSPAEAVRAATILAAEFLRLENRLGVVRVGRLADLLIIDGDPLEGVHVLERVRLVMQRGVVVIDHLAER